MISYLKRIFFFFVLLKAEVFAQNINLIKTVQIPFVQNVSMDFYGNIYVADSQGNLTQYNEKGDSLKRFAPEQVANLHSLEAWKGLEILLFYRDLQRYTWLNRFLVPLETQNLDSEKIGFARLLTYANDGNLWLFDEQDFSLKKYQTNTNTVHIKTPCDLIFNPKIYSLSFLREYQNQVFLVDSNSGIFIFDNFGNYKKNLQISNINFISFVKDDIAYIDKNVLYLRHLYTDVQHKLHLPIEYNYKDFFLISTNYVYLFTSKEMLIFKYNKKNP
ncbi:hypothetical protein AD998_07115 [bacterium 336/3]|nr:hypothetical protein AD998_07115 [bacterium 336/3]